MDFEWLNQNQGILTAIIFVAGAVLTFLGFLIKKLFFSENSSKTIFNQKSGKNSVNIQSGRDSNYGNK
jgi:hypothetical protein